MSQRATGIQKEEGQLFVFHYSCFVVHSYHQLAIRTGNQPVKNPLQNIFVTEKQFDVRGFINIIIQ